MTTRFLHYAIFVFDDCSDPNCFYRAGFSTKINLLFDINLDLLDLHLALFVGLIANYHRFDYQLKAKVILKSLPRKIKETSLSF